MDKPKYLMQISLKALARHESLAAYARTLEGAAAADAEDFTVPEAVVQRVAALIDQRLNAGITDDLTEDAVALLTRHNCEYQWLFDRYNNVIYPS
ncbi:hypothetical protein [Geopseudomonas aromaticivorans]